MRCVAACAFAVLLATPSTLRAAVAIYWQDDAALGIYSAAADGSNVQEIVSTSHGGTGIAVDLVNGKVYWTTNLGAAEIWRSNLDGTNAEAIVTTGLSVPEGITVDAANGKIYWTDQGVNKISRANLDGSGIEVLVTGTTQHPHDLDVFGGKVYWTDSLINDVFRANLDGSDIEVIADLGPDNVPFPSPRGLAVDALHSKVYWASQGTGSIQRSNLDGSDLETVIHVDGWNGPDGIAIDSIEGKLYWTGLNEVLKIQRSNLDGTGIEDLVTVGLAIPRGIDVGQLSAHVPELSSIVAWFALLGALVWREVRRRCA